MQNDSDHKQKNPIPLDDRKEGDIARAAVASCAIAAIDWLREDGGLRIIGTLNDPRVIRGLRFLHVRGDIRLRTREIGGRAVFADATILVDTLPGEA